MPRASNACWSRTFFCIFGVPLMFELRDGDGESPRFPFAVRSRRSCFLSPRNRLVVDRFMLTGGGLSVRLSAPLAIERSALRRIRNIH